MVDVNGEALVKHIPGHMEGIHGSLSLKNFNLNPTFALHLLRSGSHYIEH